MHFLRNSFSPYGVLKKQRQRQNEESDNGMNDHLRTKLKDLRVLWSDMAGSSFFFQLIIPSDLKPRDSQDKVNKERYEDARDERQVGKPLIVETYGAYYLIKEVRHPQVKKERMNNRLSRKHVLRWMKGIRIRGLFWKVTLGYYFYLLVYLSQFNRLIMG